MTSGRRIDNPVPLRAAGLSGIMAAIISLSSILIAIGMSPWFTWTGSWLSDLGRTTQPSATVFNNGLILGGMLGVLFSIGMRRAGIFRGEESEMGLATLFLATLFLAFVGLFPVDAGAIHTTASLLFFVFTIVSLILLGNVLRKTLDKRYGQLVLCLGMISAASFPFFFVDRPWGTNAVVEMVSSLSITVFVLVTGAMLLKKKIT
jgi:hypothetical membrane protein